MLTQPLSQRRRTGQPTGCLVVFFLIFLLVGAFVSYVTLVRPLAGYLAARSWQETTCTVLESRVAESSDSDGTTYRPEISYTYSASGRAYRSERYDFLEVWSSGRSGKEAIVARHPPGARVACWIDPEAPENAVLSRDLGWAHLLGLLPLIFVFVGVGGLVWTLRASRRGTAAAPVADLPSPASPFGVLPPAAAGGGLLELRSKLSPVGKFVGLVLVGLFWNGIVSIFVWQAVAAWRGGEPDGCLTVFLIPFVLVGLGLILGACRQFLVLFNPRPRLTLSPGTLTPGQSAYLQWRLEGAASRVGRFRIVLQGREEARYRRGTDVHTDRQTFASLTLLDSTQPYELAGGSTGFSVPADAMPSFSAENNKIVWALTVTCEIRGWPDSDEEFEIVVQPSLGGGGAV